MVDGYDLAFKKFHSEASCSLTLFAFPALQAQYILDDQGDKVWISTVTLADIRKACKTGQAPNKNRRELVRLPSKQNREAIYHEAALAIANKEQECMALYGGRPWTVTARVTEPKNTHLKPPLFRWYRGELELAVLPHLLEKVPEPPKLKGNQEYIEEEEYVPSTSLEERTVSTLSWVAWEDNEYAIPNVTVKWLSPDHLYFYSRKSAWEHQNKLAEQQLYLQKIIQGLGHRGQKLAPFKPTKNDTMKAGKWRFLRDGLWVVGQEEAWQEERAVWWEEEIERKAAAALEAKKKKEAAKRKKDEQDRKPPAKRSLTGLNYYLHCQRHKYRDEQIQQSQEPITMTLREAETELRNVWKTLSKKERDEWTERAKQVASKETGDVSAADDTTAAMQNELSVTLAVSDAGDGTPQEHKKAPLNDNVAGASAASGEEQAHAPVSPSPPSVPSSSPVASMNESAAQSTSHCTGLAPETAVIPESVETQLANEDNHAASTSLKPGSQVLSESKASVTEVMETVTKPESNVPPAATKGHQELGSEIVASGGGSPMASATAAGSFNPSPSSASENETTQTSKLVPGSQVLSESEASAMTTHSNDNCQTKDDAQNCSTLLKPKPSPAALPSSKKRRMSAARASKSIVPSSQFRMTPAQIELCHKAVMNHFDTVMNTVKARALHSELQDGFDVLRERGRGRYDMELPVFDNPEFSFLANLQGAAWMPIVKEVLGEDVILIHKGAFLSVPGAAAQEYHQDGPHLSSQTQRPCHAVNVFIPLVDLHLKNGPTEFCLGTHVLGHEDYIKDRVYTPCVPAGTPVMFDYRLGHRGMANSSSACRPIVYCTYAATANGKEFRDSVNFSRRRYRKIGEMVEKPLSRAERAAKRRKSQSDAASASSESKQKAADGVIFETLSSLTESGGQATASASIQPRDSAARAVAEQTTVRNSTVGEPAAPESEGESRQKSHSIKETASVPSEPIVPAQSNHSEEPSPPVESATNSAPNALPYGFLPFPGHSGGLHAQNFASAYYHPQCPSEFNFAYQLRVAELARIGEHTRRYGGALNVHDPNMYSHHGTDVHQRRPPASSYPSGSGEETLDGSMDSNDTKSNNDSNK